MDKNEQKRIIAKIIAKAWKEPEFKKKLLANPKAALAEMGYKIPANMNIRMHEDTDTTHNFVLPPSPAHSRELSNAELEKLSAAVKANDTWPCTYAYAC